MLIKAHQTHTVSFNMHVLSSIGVARGGPGGPAPPIEITPMIKNYDNKA